ncbi:hypothetical protein PVN32_22545 [Bacillus paralicheniformis]|uniref:DUF4177 domain-containing protein n=1 Tax=Bacillus paralicheniformis TaxID=1648923 RepID=A0AAW6KJN3_9BACI|nr:hypothetical protein [Bacillus paralicheniformis]MDE1383296.1 hypothetical protein [Bacillus paralicheniformis]MDE1454908.1 hypothetical protein [Bacillus paralicheniformis]
MLEFDVVITREYADKESIAGRTDKGWTFVATVPAKMVHPYALESDKATIFCKYTAPKIPDDIPEAPFKEAE